MINLYEFSLNVRHYFTNTYPIFVNNITFSSWPECKYKYERIVFIVVKMFLLKKVYVIFLFHNKTCCGFKLASSFKFFLFSSE